SLTSSEVSFSNNLKFSTKRAASASYFFQYSSLFARRSLMVRSISRNSGQARGTSNPKQFIFSEFYFGLLLNATKRSPLNVWLVNSNIANNHLPSKRLVTASTFFVNIAAAARYKVTKAMPMTAPNTAELCGSLAQLLPSSKVSCVGPACKVTLLLHNVMQ
ncbi:MAG: hypothetical protein U5K79_21210, partial [Cyclobacteriaceae bacterium]|nr:hypothetical protein [Cyclobacteriaceae bacterium]